MKLFVWDFHGVLEKGNENAVLEISNTVLSKLGYSQQLSMSECDKLYGLKWYEYFEHLIPSESHEKHVLIQDECVKYQQANPQIITKHLQTNDYAIDVLETIIHMGHQQILISNTTPGSMQSFLDAAKVSNYFSNGNYYAINAHTKNGAGKKSSVLRDFLEDKVFDNIIAIGDSQHDVDLVSVAGGTSYLYAHPGKKFRGNDAHYKINDLREVLREV